MYMERMSEERTVKKVFKNTSAGKGSVGKTRKRCLEADKNDLKKWVLEAGGK
jgi:hypothetical protein